MLDLIRGSGYTLGSANPSAGVGATEINGYALIDHSDGSVLVVSIQYRLGVFGFLDPDEVTARILIFRGLEAVRVLESQTSNTIVSKNSFWMSTIPWPALRMTRSSMRRPSATFPGSMRT